MGLNNSSAPQASKYVPPHMRNRSSGPRTDGPRPDGPRPDGNANSGWAAWNSGDRPQRNRYGISLYVCIQAISS